jgi:selenocysteine lyase/cysteine desulfurase
MNEWHKEFPQKPDMVFLNHAAVSPWPLRTMKAVNDFANENVTSGPVHYPLWLKEEKLLRTRLARLVNVPSIQDIALSKNTSEALSMIAYGIDWHAGDNVVISNHEFPSNRIVWESLSRFGVAVKIADLDREQSPESAIIDAIDDNTRLVSLSSVQYASGLKMNCKIIGKTCRERGILFCIDAIQSLGAVTFDAMDCMADFVVADGHKWMMGPEGLALFYSRPEAREQLKLTQFGWHMVKHRGDYTRNTWQPADNAQRFECGSPNMLGIYALNASLSLLEDIGMAKVEKALETRVEYLINGLRETPEIKLLSATEPERRAGIVTFQKTSKDSKQLYGELLEMGIFCAYRGGGVRFSPHFYTPLEKIDHALDAVRKA